MDETVERVHQQPTRACLTSPSIDRYTVRQLCISVTHSVSRLLDTSQASTLLKQPESRSNPGRLLGDFQAAPLNHSGTSPRKNRGLGSLFGLGVSSKSVFVQQQSSTQDRNTEGTPAPGFVTPGSIENERG